MCAIFKVIERSVVIRPLALLSNCNTIWSRYRERLAAYEVYFYNLNMLDLDSLPLATQTTIITDKDKNKVAATYTY
jgi:hypothetical protein